MKSNKNFDLIKWLKQESFLRKRTAIDIVSAFAILDGLLLVAVSNQNFISVIIGGGLCVAGILTLILFG